MRRGFTLIELLVVIAIIAILAAILFPVFSQAREKARQTVCMSGLKQIGMGLQQYIQDYDEKFPPHQQAGRWNEWHSRPTCQWAATASNPWLRFPVLIDAYIRNLQVYECPSAKLKWFGRNRRYETALPCNWPLPTHVQPRWVTFDQSIGFNFDYLFERSLPQVREVASAVYSADAAHPEAASSVGRVAFADRCAVACGPDWSPRPPDWERNDAFIDQATRHLRGSNITYVDGHTKWSRFDKIWADWVRIYKAARDRGLDSNAAQGEAFEIMGLWYNGPWALGF